MSEISASLVKELRSQTGAGMMDCKKALMETGGDIEQSIDWLRTKGLSAAAKKSTRVASEGLVGIATKGTSGALVEVNAETDFVARNPEFQKFVLNVAEVALSAGTNLEQLKKTIYPGTNHSVDQELIEMVGKIGENMVLRRMQVLSVSKGIVAGYLHNSVVPNAGKIGVLIGLESEGSAKTLEEFGHKLAMHICAARPVALDTKSIDPQLVERERTVLKEQAGTSGKPPEIVEKMVDGRLRKYYQEVVFEEQLFVIDGESTVKKVLTAFEKELESSVKVSEFVRFELGEGVEKEDEDFAAEVAAQIKK